MRILRFDRCNGTVLSRRTTYQHIGIHHFCRWVIPRQIAQKMAFLTPTPFDFDDILHRCYTQWVIITHGFLGPGDLWGQRERSRKVMGFCWPWDNFGHIAHSRIVTGSCNHRHSPDKSSSFRMSYRWYTWPSFDLWPFEVKFNNLKFDNFGPLWFQRKLQVYGALTWSIRRRKKMMGPLKLFAQYRFE